jgi:5'-nucleotidase
LTVKKTFIFAVLTAVAGGVMGCANKGNASIPQNESVADVSTPMAASSYQPAPQAVAQPVVYDHTLSSSAPTASTSIGGTYTVKKGDTLYSIARQRYNDGKQWQKIAAANPGLRPESLKVGQTITIP